MNKQYKSVELYIGAFCNIVMIASLFIQVIARYVFGHALPWPEEVATIMFILSIYFGATAAIRNRQQLRMTVLLESLKGKKRMILEIFDNFVFALFNVIVLFGIVPLVMNLYERSTRYAVTQVPKWIVYVLLPILFVVMIVRLIQDSIQRVRDCKEEVNSASAGE